MSPAAQPWKPPDDDRQSAAWSPPQSDRATTAQPSLLDEGVRLAKIASGASGLTALKNVVAPASKAAMDFITGSAVNPRDVEQAKSAASSLLGGIANEPNRVWQELAKSGTAMAHGDINAAADHLWYAVPMAGAAGEAMADYLKRGDIKGALAHGVGSLLPFAHEPVIGAAGRAVEALPAAAETTRTALSKVGTAGRGAAGGIVEAIPTAAEAAAEKSIYGALGGPAGMVAAAKLAAAKELGKGAVTGARRALAKRAAQSAAASAAEAPAAAAAAIETPPLQLPPGPIITPAPADTSYVRSVPAEYPPTFTLTPNEQALADHILQNVEPPQPAPPAPPPEPPASPGSLNPPAAAKPTSAEIAAQLEASMRAETLTDYVTRKQIPAAMVENFSAPHWETLARDAGVQPPNPQQITEILDNLAQRDAAKNITATTAPNSPAEAAADFQRNRALRNPGEEPPAAAAPEPAPPPPRETPPAGAAAPKHAIDVAGRGDLPDTKWMTEDGLREYAADNQMTEDAARTALAESGHKILGRAKLNRAIHALGNELGLDHDTIRDTAAMTYGVKSLTQLTQDQMLQMYEHLAEQQSASQPLVGKSARAALTPPDALAEKLKVLAGKPDAARFIEELKAQAAAAPEPPPDAAPPAAAAQTLRDLMQPAVKALQAARENNPLA